MMQREYRLVIRLKYFAEPGTEVPNLNAISSLVDKALERAGFDAEIEQFLDAGFRLDSENPKPELETP